MTSPTDDWPELLTPGTYVRRFFAFLAILGATVSGQVTAVSPLTERGMTYVLEAARSAARGVGTPHLTFLKRPLRGDGCLTRLACLTQRAVVIGGVAD